MVVIAAYDAATQRLWFHLVATGRQVQWRIHT